MSVQDVAVVGAGVTGLTTGVVLAESGNRVEVITRERMEHTTSMAAGAIWGPYLVEPKDRVATWSALSLATFTELAARSAPGVRLVSGTEAARVAVEPPDWAASVDDFTLCAAPDLPDGFVSGWRYTVPLIDMPTYLAYLAKRLRNAGGRISVNTVENLNDVTHPVVVNCAGIGARELAGDPELFPIRGQLVVVDNPGLTEFFSEDTGSSPDLLCIYPHGDHVVLGGTAEPHRWDTEPDPAAASAIVERSSQIYPALAAARIREHRVGLRPTRPQIRVATAPAGHGKAALIHNYGHGGAGVTLSWGCAREVQTLLSQMAPR